MFKKLSAFAFTVAAALVSSSIAYACVQCIMEWPDPNFTGPQQQQIGMIVGQLAKPGQEGQVGALVNEFVNSHTRDGYTVDDAIAHLTDVTQ